MPRSKRARKNARDHGRDARDIGMAVDPRSLTASLRARLARDRRSVRAGGAWRASPAHLARSRGARRIPDGTPPTPAATGPAATPRGYHRAMSTDRTANDGMRVVLDARPLQAPSRNPTTALYLDALLGAFAADPRPAESFLFLLDSPGPDPSVHFPGLAFAGRRRLPPTRRLRAATLTLDPFLLRAASLGTRGGAPAAVLH